MIMVRPNKITKRNNAVPPAAINTQDNTTGLKAGITAGTTYGEGEKLKEQARLTGMPDAELAKPTTPTRKFTPVDVFGQTQMEDQPITDGAPVGPGRMGATLTPVQRGDLFMRALAEGFPTSDTMSLYEDGLDQFEIGLDG
tara:strand:- start:225 stop:647 length:423 start_codon:yes stop_codon:yes gene_type:complete